MQMKFSGVQVLQFVVDAVKAEAFNPRTLFLFWYLHHRQRETVPGGGKGTQQKGAAPGKLCPPAM